MADFIKKTSQAGGSKSKETYIAHKRFREDKDEDKEEKKEDKKIEYIKRKKESKWLKKKKKKKEEDKKEDKKEDKIEYIKKIERVDANTGGLMSGFPKLAKKGWK